MTKYCKCGHKKSEHSSRLGEVDFTGADEYGSYRGWQKSGQLLAFTGLACDGGIFHHSHWEYHDPKMKDTGMSTKITRSRNVSVFGTTPATNQ